MRPLHVYLVLYFAALFGAVLTLWQAGILARVPLAWTMASVLAAVALGVALMLASTRPAPPADAD